MSITAFAIRKNRVTFVALFAIIFAGITAFLTSPKAEDPGFTMRIAQVITYFPGASPERVEMLVTDKLEKVIQEIPELDKVTSTSKTGVSVVVVHVKDSFDDMRPIWDNLRRKADKVASDLPDGTIGPIVNDEFGEVFGIIFSITGEGFTYSEIKDIADEVRDELLLNDQVAKVDIYGAQEERIFVEYSNARLSELGLSPGQFSQLLQARNIIVPGGDVRVGNERLSLEPSGNFESIRELQRAVISIPGSKEVLFLEDVARVYRGYVDPPSNRMRSTGKNGLALAVSMREGGNIEILGQQVMEIYERVSMNYPIGVNFEMLAYQPEVVKKTVDDFTGNLVQAVGIVIAIMLLTLGLRTGIVVATLIPMAMLATLMFMKFFGIGIDQMSLAALIIALGLLVDNSIVMSESVMVKIGEGNKPYESAVQAARELQIPLLTSSLTTSAAFLPIFLAESTTGEYCAPLFTVVTITLLCSWFLSLTMTPLLCYMFIKVKKKHEGFNSAFYRLYRGFLLVLLRNRIATLAVIVIILFGSVYALKYVPKLFFPASDRPMFSAELRLPPGTAIEHTEQVVTEIEACMEEHFLAGEKRKEGLTSWGTWIGKGAPRYVLTYSPEPSSPGYAYILMNATSRSYVDEVIPQLRQRCLESVPDLEATVRTLETGSPVGTPVEVKISGLESSTLFGFVDEIVTRFDALEGVTNVGHDWGRKTKKLFVTIDEQRAIRAGVTNQDIAVSLQTALGGMESTQFREDDKTIPVILRSTAADRQDIGKIESLNVFAQASGQSVELLQVADISLSWEYPVVRRENRIRVVTVGADLLPGFTAAMINAEVVPWLEEAGKDWERGYSWALGGEAEASGNATTAITEKMPIAGLIILLLMIGQFNSIRKTFIVLATIPFGIIGVSVGLLAARSYFGFMTLLGIISLFGIIINNAIVLLDRIEIEIEENGHEPPRAIIEAAQRRLRPILLTTMTTVGGLIPLWLGGGPMWEPLAISIIFGLIFATVLTLGLVPVLYSILYRVKFAKFQYETETD